ncbi:MAG: hypothetical protein CFE24_13165 [Flavobacterium sp. BFFFF2]|nr:MAG: hypothetical protein CFE24_13165 [Flavobacterium sp. BFFFF2]
MKKTLFLLLFTIVGGQLSFAQFFETNGIRYLIKSGTTVAVANQFGQASGDVIIPERVNNYANSYNVIDIDPNAFWDCTNLTSVTFPKSVTNLWGSYFHNCPNLTTATLPNTVTAIQGTFYNCTGLKSITIPDSVKHIGIHTFQGCTSLTTLTIPNSVTHIGDEAFKGCTGLTSLTIPDSITIIDQEAFSGCTGLKSVAISNSVTRIERLTFFGCTGLTSVTIPNSVTSIGPFAFFGCTGLTSLTIPNSTTKIDSEAFRDCAGLTLVTIPNSVTSIGNFAFFGCSSLKTVICNATKPIDISSSPAFYGLNYAAISLYVPSGSVTAYQAAPAWKDFAPIICVNQTIPAFAQVAPVCSGATMIALPTISNNNITGTWLPALNNLATNTYTFISTARSCASIATMSIKVNTVPPLAPQSKLLNGGYQLSTVPGYGSSYKVYASAEATAAFPSTAFLTSGTYFAAQTQNGCESIRSLLTVAVYSLAAVSSPACGSTLNAISAPISVTAVANATNYLFEVTGNGATRTYNSPTNSFNLTQLQGTITYNTAYSIRVAAGFNGQYGDFGAACTLTTPAFGKYTQVISTTCGTTLPTMNTPINCNQIAGVQAYRFEFTTGGVSRTLESTTNSVQIGNLVGGTTFGAAYSVRVAVKVDGIWQDYGTACTVTTPAPITQVRNNSCGSTLANKWTTVYCAAVTGATSYRFEWKKGASTLTFNSSTPNMQLGNFTGWAVNTNYSVRVAVQYGGIWQAYGTACNIKSPANAN